MENEVKDFLTSHTGIRIPFEKLEELGLPNWRDPIWEKVLDELEHQEGYICYIIGEFFQIEKIL